jgi:hypothetical protein
MNCRLLCALAGATVALALGGQAVGQVPSESAGAPTTLKELMEAAKDQIEVFAGPQADKPAEVLVALRWANNARGSEDGRTLLYVHEGRPLAAACLYPWDGRLVHDFECISRDKIVARQGGTTVWQPQISGVKFATIPDAPAVADTPAGRLRQLRSLAAEFESAMLGWKADSSDREELRLLPRPLYRYEPKAGPVIDGAVFAFVMGTDPESLLLIEAFQGDGGAATWQFGFARRTSGELEGRHQGTVVWHADRYPGTKDPSGPHFSVGQPIPSAVLPGPSSKQESAR